RRAVGLARPFFSAYALPGHLIGAALSILNLLHRSESARSRSHPRLSPQPGPLAPTNSRSPRISQSPTAVNTSPVHTAGLVLSQSLAPPVRAQNCRVL